MFQICINGDVKRRRWTPSKRNKLDEGSQATLQYSNLLRTTLEYIVFNNSLLLQLPVTRLTAYQAELALETTWSTCLFQMAGVTFGAAELLSCARNFPTLLAIPDRNAGFNHVWNVLSASSCRPAMRDATSWTSRLPLALPISLVRVSTPLPQAPPFVSDYADKN
jgi:hypothetical protein